VNPIFFGEWGMETWQAILAAVTGNVVALAAIGFLGKSLIENALVKNAKRFEHDLKAAADSAIVHLSSELQGRQQLRMAAVETRLQAHQEAFTMWRRLVDNDQANGAPMVIQCQKWWDEHCVYLEPQVRQAFVVAYSSEHLRAQLVSARAPSEEIIEVFDKVMEFPNILFKAVALPPLSQAEAEAITPSTMPRQNRSQG
jgi:SAM-dependent MidA family methyltransferase